MATSTSSTDSGITFEKPFRPWTYHQVVRKLQKQGYFCDRRILRSDTEMWRNKPTFPIPHRRSGCEPKGNSPQEEFEKDVISLSPQVLKEALSVVPNSDDANSAQCNAHVSDPIELESQDILSSDNHEKQGDVIVLIDEEGCEETQRPCSTKEHVVEALANTHIAFVPTGEPFNDDEFMENVPRTFYFFLTSVNLPTLKSVARDYQLKTTRPRTVLLARIFLRFMLDHRADNNDLTENLSAENLSIYKFFTKKIGCTLTDKEMPTVRFFNDAAHAESRKDAPPPHPSMLTPPFREILNGGSKGDRERTTTGKRKDTDSKMESYFLRNLRPRRLFQSDQEKENGEKHIAKRNSKVHMLRSVLSPASNSNIVGKGGNSEGRNPKSITGNGRKDAGSEKGLRVSDDAVAEREENNSSKGLTPSEFARLILLLKDDELCRAAFKNSGQVLSRQEIDKGEKSSNFRTTVVEPAFNDENNTIQKDCSSVLPDIDPSLPPVSSRTGDYLCTAFKSFRSKFMHWMFRYNSSGHNSRDFKTFVVEKGVDPSTALGKRIILAGFIIGIDALHPDHEFMNVLRRTIGNKGKGGYDARMSPDGDESNVENSIFNGGSRKGKKNYMSGIIQDKSVKALDAITNCAQKCDKIQEMRLARTVDTRSEASPVHDPRSNPPSDSRAFRGCDGRAPPEKEDRTNPFLFESLLERQVALLDKIAAARVKLSDAESNDDIWLASKWEKFIESASKHLDRMTDEMDMSDVEQVET